MKTTKKQRAIVQQYLSNPHMLKYYTEIERTNLYYVLFLIQQEVWDETVKNTNPEDLPEMYKNK